jgi:hypothetical protein
MRKVVWMFFAMLLAACGQTGQQPRPAAPPLPPPGPAYAGLSYDDTPEIATRRLESIPILRTTQEYEAKLLGTTQYPLDMVFIGRLQDRSASITLFFNPERRLTSVEVRIDPPMYVEYLDFYRKFARELTDKFGSPSRVPGIYDNALARTQLTVDVARVAAIDFPYERPPLPALLPVDLNEAHAFATEWKRGIDTVVLVCLRDYTVALVYLGPYHEAEMKRRARIRNTVF